MNSAKWRMGCLAALLAAAGAGPARGELHTVTADTTYSHYVEYSHLGSVEHTYDIRVPAGLEAAIVFTKVKYEDANTDRGTRKLRLYENGALHSLTGVADDTYATTFYGDGTIRLNTEIGPTYHKEAIWGQNSLGPYIIGYQTIYYKAYYTRQHYTLGITYAPSSGPPPVPVVPNLVKITISGSPELYPGGNTNYTCTATMDDGSTKVVKATWSIQSAPAGRVSINASTGRLQSEKYSDITEPIPVVIAASYTENGITRRDTFAVTILVPPKSLGITGASTVTSSRPETYTCTLHMADGQTKSVSPTWSISSGSSCATISSNGVLTAKTVTSPTVVTLLASHVEGIYTCRREKTVTNLPPSVVAPAVTVATCGNSAVAGSITVKWTGGTGATSFHLYRSTTSVRPGTAIRAGVTSPYVDDDPSLTPGVKYYYWVEAKNAEDSAFSQPDYGNRAVTLELGETAVPAAGAGGTHVVAVEANTAWEAASGEEWIHFAAGAGSGNGTVRFTVDENTGASARSGTVTVTAGGGTAFPEAATFRVEQGGGAVAVGSCGMDAENGQVQLRFAGEKGVTYLLQRAQELGGAWTTLWTFTAENDGECAVDAAIPSRWHTGFYRVDRKETGGGGTTPGTETNAAGAKYLVVDLSGGPSAPSWPVSELDGEPAGGWTDEHKTTKLVLRRIEAGRFTMGSPSGELGRDGYETKHEVTLTQPFYIGVFEVTQKQWELAMGENPSHSTGDTRPVETVSYDDIRGKSAGAKWPRDDEVDAGSFLAKLRSKTGGIRWDLPTEAQWEHACRAGTTTALNNGRDLTTTTNCANLSEVGRYSYNNGYQGGTQDGKGGYATEHTAVGSYRPNAWGLHDMHGNVMEWCLDWYADHEAEALTDPAGAESGRCRVLRGGAWNVPAQFCRSASRRYIASSSLGFDYFGFRLCCPAGVP